jgi:hypothetical protein
MSHKKHRKHNHHHQNERLDIVSENCGHGMHAKISIVKRESDGKEIIWKRPISDNPEHRKALRKEIKRSKYWRKFGVSKVKVCLHSDKISLLKTYIKGKTLTQTLEKDHHFFSKTKSRSVSALGEFIRLLIDSRHYIQNLSCENLVFDGKKWHVVDSSNILERDSHSKIKREYKKKFFGIWSKRLHSNDEINSLKSFLKKYCH